MHVILTSGHLKLVISLFFPLVNLFCTHSILSYLRRRQPELFSKYVWSALCILHGCINQSILVIHRTSNWRLGLTIKCEKTFPPCWLFSRHYWGIPPRSSCFKRFNVTLHHLHSISGALFNNSNELPKDKKGRMEEKPQTYCPLISAPDGPVTLSSHFDCRDKQTENSDFFISHQAVYSCFKLLQRFLK